MNKIKITLEIESGNKKEIHMSKFEKLIGAFMRLVRKLRPRDKAELSRLIIVVSALVAQSYLLVWLFTSILNHP